MRPAITVTEWETVMEKKYATKKPKAVGPMEKHIERTILTYLNCNPNLFAWKYPTTGRYLEKSQKYIKTRGTITGVSDLICVGKTKENKPFVAFFEVKGDKGRQTDNQKWFEGRVKGLNNFYFVVRCIEDVNCALMEIEQKLN